MVEFCHGEVEMEILAGTAAFPPHIFMGVPSLSHFLCAFWLHSSFCFWLFVSAWPLHPGQHTFSIKGQIVSILGFIGDTVPAATTQLCHRVKSTLDNTQTNEHSCVPSRPESVHRLDFANPYSRL